MTLNRLYSAFLIFCSVASVAMTVTIVASAIEQPEAQTNNTSINQ